MQLAAQRISRVLIVCAGMPCSVTAAKGWLLLQGSAFSGRSLCDCRALAHTQLCNERRALLTDPGKARCSEPPVTLAPRPCCQAPRARCSCTSCCCLLSCMLLSLSACLACFCSCTRLRSAKVCHTQQTPMIACTSPAPFDTHFFRPSSCWACSSSAAALAV